MKKKGAELTIHSSDNRMLEGPPPDHHFYTGILLGEGYNIGSEVILHAFIGSPLLAIFEN